MIKKVTDSDELSGVLSPLLPLISADFEFNNTETDGLYVQRNGEDEVTSVFYLKNGCVTLAAVDDAVDTEELNQFFTFLSVDSCLSDSDIFTDNCKALPLLCGDTGSAENTGAVKLDEYSRLCEYEAAYSLLNDNGNNFPQWFAVASKKINIKKSVLVYMCENNVPVSVAMATAVYNNTAIISGVFTRADCRGKGFASKCVSSLLSELNAMGVVSAYLWCEKHNLPFYERLGFSVCGNVFVREGF